MGQLGNGSIRDESVRGGLISGGSISDELIKGG